MNEDIVEVTVRISVVGPRAAECVDLIVQDIEGITHLTGNSGTLSGARVVEVRR